MAPGSDPISTHLRGGHQQLHTSLDEPLGGRAHAAIGACHHAIAIVHWPKGLALPSHRRITEELLSSPQRLASPITSGSSLN